MDLLSQLRRDEGVRPTPYHDTKGNLTYGIGHKADTPLTDAAMNLIAQNDIAAKTSELLREFPWMRGYSITRFNVFVNMAFNMGVGKVGSTHGLGSFHDMLEAAQDALTSEKFQPIADAMRASQWHKEVGARAERLAVQMETGIPQ